MKRTVYGALALALLFVGCSLLPTVTTVQDLSIGGYTLVGKTRISRFHYDLAYSAKLTNGGSMDVAGATAKLRPFLDILIIDGQLSFGPVKAGQTVPSADTFTLRWPIAQPISPRILERWLRWNTTIANAAPQADAGPDQTVPLNAAVRLDGTGSSDADGDPLTYRWEFTAKPASSTAALSGADTATPTFVAHRPGNYDIELIVNDGQSDSTPDTVRISTANSAPSADAGTDQTAFVGNTATLDGTASSDVDGDPITYQWSFTTKPAGSQAVLSDPTVPQPSFTVDKPGDYLIQLLVNDGKVDSVPDSVQVSTQNSAPMANAGPDQGVLVNTTVQLDGSQSSDADGNTLTYRWSLLNKPANSAAVLANDQAVNPSFTVDKPGSYAVQLIVNDGTVDSPPDQIVVSQNSRPVANAGAHQTATVDHTVSLDGNGSQDADGDNLSFTLSLITKPANSTAALTGADTATPSFIPDQAGEYTAQLIVSDGQLDSDPDTALVTVNVAPVNQDPIAGDDSATTTAGTPVDIAVLANDSDPDNDPLAISVFTQGTNGTVAQNGNLLTYTPVAGFTGTDSFIDTISDGRGGTDTATVSVTVDPRPLTNEPPSVDAGPGSTVTLPDTATLDGTVTDDGLANPPSLTTLWSTDSGPGPVVFGNATAVDTTASFTADGTYILRLTANDGSLSASDTVTITVAPGVTATSFELIEKALADGIIDAETALVYKVYVEFNDDRLPAQYRGRDDGFPEARALIEAAGRFNTLSPATQQLLAPFLLRPDAPGSWYELRKSGQGARAIGTMFAALQTGSVTDAGQPRLLAAAVPITVTNWGTGLGTKNGKVKIWWDQDRPQDGVRAQKIADEIDRIGVWDKLTKLLGEPLQDDQLPDPELAFGGDGRLDIMIVDIAGNDAGIKDAMTVALPYPGGCKDEAHPCSLR